MPKIYIWRQLVASCILLMFYNGFVIGKSGKTRITSNQTLQPRQQLLVRTFICPKQTLNELNKSPHASPCMEVALKLSGEGLCFYLGSRWSNIKLIHQSDLISTLVDNFKAQIHPIMPSSTQTIAKFAHK